MSGQSQKGRVRLVVNEGGAAVTERGQAGDQDTTGRGVPFAKLNYGIRITPESRPSRRVPVNQCKFIQQLGDGSA